MVDFVPQDKHKGENTAMDREQEDIGLPGEAPSPEGVGAAEWVPPSSEAGTGDARQDRHELKREIIDFVKLVVWFLVVFLILRAYVIEAYEVQGPSMFPTLETNERILVLKLPHVLSQLPLFGGINAIHGGDIIVFDSPDNPDKRYVKRVIAMGPAREQRKTVAAQAEDGLAENPPGTVKVVYDRGDVFVNNHRLDEPYLEDDARKSRDRQTLTLSPGDFYVLGDNRSVSKDSRSFNAISDESIIGTAVLRFWPLSKFSLMR